MSQLLESGENYLETILVLSQKNGNVRSIDIATELNFSKPSISRAVAILKTGGFIEVDANGFITLTDAGREVAERMYERHTIISAWLKELGVDEETATEDACRIEHVISQASFDKLKEHIRSSKEHKAL